MPPIVPDSSPTDPQPTQQGWSLVRKGTLFAIAISALPVALVGSCAFIVADQTFEPQIRADQVANTQLVASEIAQYMFERYADILELSQDPIFTSSQLRSQITVEENEQFLDRYLSISRVGYDSLALLDTTGTDIAASGNAAHSNHSDDDYFQNALTGQIFISQPRFSQSAGQVVIYLSAPVRDQDTGDLVGVVRSRLPTAVLAPFLETRQQDEYFLVDQSNRVFLSTSPLVSQSEPLAHDAVFPGITQRLQAQPQGGSYFATQAGLDQDDADVLISFALVPTLQDMPDLGWRLSHSIDEDVAFAAITRMGNTIIVGTIFSAIVISVIASLTVSRTIKPLQDAAAAVEQIGQGQLDKRLVVEGNDEVAILCLNINRMAQQLQQVLSEVQLTAQELESKNEQIESDSAMLQLDVGHILDVVSSLEDGDLTVQAKVSDRATGLVADTLNRLIEELASVIAVTFTTAQQVTQGASDLEAMASNTAKQAEQQATSVAEVRLLMEGVSQLSQDSARQSMVADQALNETQEAVLEGQQELSSMSEGLSTLKDGSEQIVKRVQTLNQFIELASQFTKDQKRIASLTRVLALNASTLAARALGQEDPDQFASIAREFETIASQVNDLAQQTNQGLQVLQQRTDQIQTVVSGLNKDVTEITDQVTQFATGTERSKQAFDNIQTLTERVTLLGQDMTLSSQSIAEAADNTLQAMEKIALIAAEADQKASITQDQTHAMKTIADRLLSTVQFFQIAEALQMQTLDVSYSNGSTQAQESSRNGHTSTEALLTSNTSQ